MQMTISTDPNPKSNDDNLLREAIVSFNMQTLGERADHFSIFLRDENSIIHGGATVWVHSESIYVDVLWVADELRGQGYGTKIMFAAEAEAIKRGCKYSTVDTYSFQAKDFYLKLGYAQIGEIPNYLFEHAKIFLRKTLNPPSSFPYEGRQK